MSRRRICPNCRLIELNFTSKPSGGVTARCMVCSRGYYLREGKIYDISIRCSRLGKTVPAYFCRKCPIGDECLREMMGHPTTQLPTSVKSEVAVYGA